MRDRYDTDNNRARGRFDSDASADFQNRGRSQWDDRGNNQARGDVGREAAQGYFDDRYNQQPGDRYPRYGQSEDRTSMAGNSRPFDQADLPYDQSSGRASYDQGGNGGWRGRGGYVDGGWRGGQGNQNGQGSNYSGGFGGGAAGYQANRDDRSERPMGNYGGANLTPPGGSAAYDSGQSQQERTGQYSTDWAASGQMQHHDADYHHWRSQQLEKLDRDYADWRNERRQKFSEDFESWRQSRAQNGQGGKDDDTASNGTAAKGTSSAQSASNATGSSPSGSSRHK